MLEAVFLYLIAAMAVGVAAPWAVKVCRDRRLLAPAGEDRHIHKVPTPHGGGFLLPLVVVPLGLAVVWGFSLPFKAFLTVLLLSSVAVAWVGWKDDNHHVDPLIRLAYHLAAVLMGLLFLPQLFDFMPLALEKLLLMLAWGWFVNLYNFMDGADGLAGTEAVFISLSLALLVPAFAPLTVLLAGAATGFLRVNRPPAKVFMGDVCSTWLGYVLGGLLMVSLADDTWTMIWPLATIPMVFWADATSTLVRRVAGGYKPWEPHRTFWFHRYLDAGRSHGSLLLGVCGMNAVLLVLAWGFLRAGDPFFGFLGGLLVIFAAAWYIRTHR